MFDENTACLRLGDALILVEYEGVFPTSGNWLKIILSNVDMFDTDY